MTDASRAQANGISVPVLHYVDRLMELHVEAEDKRFGEHARAIDIASAALGKRLDSMNEIKEAMKDQQASFATREEIKPLADDLKFLKSAYDKASGRASIATLISVVSVIVSIALAIFHIIGIAK